MISQIKKIEKKLGDAYFNRLATYSKIHQSKEDRKEYDKAFATYDYLEHKYYQEIKKLRTFRLEVYMHYPNLRKNIDYAYESDDSLVLLN